MSRLISILSVSSKVVGCVALLPFLVFPAFLWCIILYFINKAEFSNPEPCTPFPSAYCGRGVSGVINCPGCPARTKCGEACNA